MKMSLFVLAFIGVFILLHLYIYRRLVCKLDLHGKVKQSLTVFLIVNFVGIVLYMLARYYPLLPNWLYFLLSLPIGIVFLLFCTALVYDISSLAVRFTPMQPKRRTFFKRSLDLSSLGVAFALSSKAIYEARFVEVEDVSICLKNLKKTYTIAQLSDVHIGGIIDAAFIRSLTAKVNALKVDAVVITGDLVDIKIPHAMAALKELQNLKSTYGTFFIAGNHEYFHNLQEIIDTLKSLGIRVLENESVYIGEEKAGFNLAGVYDVFGYRTRSYMPEIRDALAHTCQESPTVLLAHQPRYVEEVAGNRVDLMLCGHTHGGQIYPFRALVKLQQPYIAGLYRHDDKLQVYVNKGTGFWGPPMRLGASAEITHISLTPA